MTSPVPGYGPETYSRENSDAQAGTAASFDPTAELGQTPASLFGVMLPQGTGAPGTQGATGQADPTNEPGQLSEGISGEGPAQIADTGAPGSTGAMYSTGGPDSAPFTPPGAYAARPYSQDTVQDHVSRTS